jgi:acetoin utilization protein AcuB
MKVSAFMTPNPITVTLDDRLGYVKELFDCHRFHHLLVVEDGVLVGVLSDRDVLKWVSPHVDSNRYTVNDENTLNRPVHLVVTRKPVTVGPDADLFDAVALFNQHRISCIPVVDAQDLPVGIVSWRDVLKLIRRPAPKSPTQPLPPQASSASPI